MSTLLGIPFAIPFLMADDKVFALACYFPYNFVASAFLGPVIAITYRLVKVRMRALASAILLFIFNLIGLGGGPQIVGLMNDVLAPTYGAEAVRYSLLVVALFAIVAVLLYCLAARTLVRDLAAAEGPV